MLDPIQNNCKYGYVLPDRCRYKRHLGCECGAYPAIPCQATFKEHCQFPKCDCDRPVLPSEEIMDVFDGPEQECYPIEKECPKTCRCETCRFWGA